MFSGKMPDRMVQVPATLPGRSCQVCHYGRFGPGTLATARVRNGTHEPTFWAAVRTNSVCLRSVVVLAVVVVAHRQRAPRAAQAIAAAAPRLSAMPAGPGRGRVPGQSCRVSMNTGICRVVLAWASSSWGYCATRLGHSWARAVSSSSSASTVSVWVATSAFILG